MLDKINEKEYLVLLGSGNLVGPIIAEREDS